MYSLHGSHCTIRWLGREAAPFYQSFLLSLLPHNKVLYGRRSGLLDGEEGPDRENKVISEDSREAFHPLHNVRSKVHRMPITAFTFF